MRSDAGRAEGTRTCLLVAGACVVAAVILYLRSRDNAAEIFGAAAALLLVVGLLFPRAAIRFHRLWMGFAGALGWVNSRILLSIVYVIVFIPYGLISRVVGRDPLARRGGKSSTYWTVREKPRQDREQYERLF